MSLLGNVENPAKLLDKILDRFRSLQISELKLKKYVNQLLIATRLRNIEEDLQLKIANMPILLKNIETSPFYKLGEERGLYLGEERGVELTARRMIEQGLDNLFIQKITELSNDRIEAIREQIKNK